MSLERMISKARQLSRQALSMLDREIAATEHRLGLLKSERSSLVGLGQPAARKVMDRVVGAVLATRGVGMPKLGETPATMALATLPQKFTLEMARRAFGKRTGISLAQLSRRKAIRKTAAGYTRVAA